jgi:hypothetical protein
MSKDLKNTKDHDLLLKHLSRIVFDMLWKKHVKSVLKTNVFKTIGQITEVILGDRYEDDRNYKKLLRTFHKDAALGTLRANASHLEDFNFIVYSDEKVIYLFLESEAVNARLAQAYRFDRDAGLFISTDKDSLIEFLIKHDICFNN